MDHGKKGKNSTHVIETINKATSQLFMFIQFLLALISAADLGECPKTTTNIKKTTYKTGEFQDVDCSKSTFTFAEDSDFFTSIDSNFFSGSIFGTITISSKIETIDSSAFEKTIILNKLNIDTATSLTAIASSAFQGSSIPGIKMPANLEYIGSKAFYESTITGSLDFSLSTKLTTLQESSTDTSFSKQVFYGATITDTFTWPENLKSLYNSPSNEDEYENCVFYGCTIGTLDLSTADTTTIGSYAFFNIKVTKEIKFPKELKIIGANAFENAQIIPAINFPNTLEMINSKAFFFSSLSTVTFNSQLELIGGSAFKDIVSLKQVKNLIAKQILGSAFSGCINMVTEKIQILGSGSVGGSAFLNCFNLGSSSELEILEATDIDEETGDMIYSDIGANAFQNSGIAKINLQYYINQIGKEAFQNCTSLTGSGKITTEKILGSAFKDDINLDSITSINATTISSNAFENCHKLKADIEIYYYGSIELEAFKNSGPLNSLKFLFNEEDGEETKNKNEFVGKRKAIGSKAFYRSGLKGSLTIPITIDEIGDNAFAHCNGLTSLTLDECDNKNFLLQIKEKAFYRSGLSGPLVIPYQAGYIGDYAFAYCKINSLEVHGSDFNVNVVEKDENGNVNKIETESKAYIGKYAFYSCGITKLDFTKWDIKFDRTTFRGCKLDQINLGNIEDIPKEAFYGMSTITKEVKIPDTVTTINDYAFAGCSQIPTITISETSKLETVSSGAFYGCSGLRSIKLPLEVTKINEYTFYKCRGLTSIEIGDLVTSIDQYAFYGCSELASELTFPVELTKIGDYAFQGCDKLTGSLEFPDTFASVGKNAFMGCKSLNGHVTFGRSISLIDEYAFRDCSGFIEGLTFPEHLYDNKVLSINKGAFYGCSGFTGDLILPEKTTLDEYAFYGCSGFNGQLDLKDMDSLPKGAFQECSGFTGSIPSKLLKSINDHAFRGCSGFNGTLDLSSLGSSEDDDNKDPGGDGSEGGNPGGDGSEGGNPGGDGSEGGNPGGDGSEGGNPGGYALREKEGNGDGLTINGYAFYNCRGLNGPLILPSPLSEVNEYAFYGCSGLQGALDCSKFTHIHRYAFYGCSGLTGPLDFEDSLTNVEQYAFADCSGFSDKLTFRVGDSLDIDQCAFKGCKGFKNGKLSFMIKNNEENLNPGSGYSGSTRFSPFYRYDYFLKIGNEAFEDTKFKNIYYLGRFEPDCDYDIGISQIKGIHTSSNYANKTFCNYPLHKSKLSGGAIAGIVIAVIVVVAVIVALIVYFVLRAKKNKDNSEGEVEMNNEP